MFGKIFCKIFDYVINKNIEEKDFCSFIDVCVCDVCFAQYNKIYKFIDFL